MKNIDVYLFEKKKKFRVTFLSSSANALNLDQQKILSFGEDLTQPRCN